MFVARNPDLYFFLNRSIFLFRSLGKSDDSGDGSGDGEDGNGLVLGMGSRRRVVGTGAKMERRMEQSKADAGDGR